MKVIPYLVKLDDIYMHRANKVTSVGFTPLGMNIKTNEEELVKRTVILGSININTCHVEQGKYDIYCEEGITSLYISGSIHD